LLLLDTELGMEVDTEVVTGVVALPISVHSSTGTAVYLFAEIEAAHVEEVMYESVDMSACLDACIASAVSVSASVDEDETLCHRHTCIAEENESENESETSLVFAHWSDYESNCDVQEDYDCDRPMPPHQSPYFPLHCHTDCDALFSVIHSDADHYYYCCCVVS
jgi:hypothetical protein